MATMNTCPVCGSDVVQPARGRRRVYCYPTCKQEHDHAVREERRVAAFQQAVGGIATREDVIELLWVAARGGSVSAMTALLLELRRKPADPDEGSSVIDELATKRGKS
jgi:hypothetical protein